MSTYQGLTIDDMTEEEIKDAIDEINYDNDITDDKVNWMLRKGTWQSMKYKMIGLMNSVPDGQEDKDYTTEPDEPYFFAHYEDVIIGKPQQIDAVKKNIRLITVEKNVKKNKNGEKISTTYPIIFIGEHHNKYGNNSVVHTLNLKFYMYRIIYKDEEYIVLSEEKLDYGYGKLTGMNIEINDELELSNSLKMKSISNLFIVQTQESALKRLRNDELIEFASRYFKNSKEFKRFLLTKQVTRSYYEQTKDFEDIMVAQQLSTKFEEYPLHKLIAGPLGTGKTSELEALHEVDGETGNIFEASISRFKGLIPSFKEKIAEPGFFLKAQRNACVDELFKMIEMEQLCSGSSQLNQRYFGALNALLEHKLRDLGSGNANSFAMEPSAKLVASTNAMKHKQTISDHLEVLDPSTVSRWLTVVQDEEEQKFISENDLDTHKDTKTIKERIISSIKSGNIYNEVYTWTQDTHQLTVTPKRKKKKELGVSMCVVSTNILQHIYQTIIDNCYSFKVDADDAQIKDILRKTLFYVKNDMYQGWSRRGEHHLRCLFDGIVKMRCLFDDKDHTFTPIASDYDLLYKIALRVVKSWDCQFNTESYHYKEVEEDE